MYVNILVEVIVVFWNIPKENVAAVGDIHLVYVKFVKLPCYIHTRTEHCDKHHNFLSSPLIVRWKKHHEFIPFHNSLAMDAPKIKLPWKTRCNRGAHASCRRLPERTSGTHPSCDRMHPERYTAIISTCGDINRKRTVFVAIIYEICSIVFQIYFLIIFVVTLNLQPTLLFCKMYFVW